MAIEPFFSDHFQHHFDENVTYWVAYSGGLDSCVLLHALAQWRREKNFTLRAVHIHHGLNPRADAWQKQSEAVCQQLDVALVVHKINLALFSANLEARARELRYAYFASLLKAKDRLCTAHHQDDQAETFLLQLMRGAGPKGLRAMAMESRLGQGKLLRPLLTFSREELQKYAQKYQLVWAEDDSNQNVKFSRNFMRQAILPTLKARWPAVAATIARSAAHCAEAESLLAEYAVQLLPSLPPCISHLKKLTFPQQKLAIRHWLAKHHAFLPSEAQLTNLLTTFLYAAADKSPIYRLGTVTIRRYRDQLVVLPPLSLHDPYHVLPWRDVSQPLEITSLKARLTTRKVQGAGIRMVAEQPCEIRFRAHNASLKKFFQRAGVPPWQRDRIPLLYIDNKLAAVIGYEVKKDFRVQANEQGMVVEITSREGE